MRKVRIGNDINVRWEVKTDGQAVSLEGKTLKLYVRSAYRKEEITTFTVEGCVVSFTYPASMQRMTGARAVILEDATEGAPRRTVCADQAFILVAHSCEENDDDVEFEDFMVSLQSNVLIGKPGLSAYEVWLSEGNTGTLEDWYAFLRKPATDIAADVAEAEAERKAAEKLRDTAENDRNDAEQERRQHEDARADAEGKRDTAETLRKQAETGRDNAETERTTAEHTRKDSEASRVAAEQERTASEQTRQENETARVTAETERKSAEQERTTAETERTTSEQARQENETARVSAETERVVAELSRQRAEAKREQAAKDNKDANDAAVADAYAAADAADTATGKANTAATNADMATANANAAADAASKVNAVLGDDNVLKVTDRTGAEKSLELVAQAAATEMAKKVEQNAADIAELSSKINEEITRVDAELTAFEFIDGYYSSHGYIAAYTENDAYSCRLIKVKKGEKYIVKGQGASSARLWFTADDNNNIIRRADASVVDYNGIIITINDGETRLGYNTIKTASIKELRYYGFIQEEFQKKQENKELLKVTSKVNKLGYFDTSYSNTAAIWQWFNISIKKGELYTISVTSNNNWSRLIIAINSSNQKRCYDNSTSENSYTGTFLANEDIESIGIYAAVGTRNLVSLSVDKELFENFIRNEIGLNGIKFPATEMNRARQDMAAFCFVFDDGDAKDDDVVTLFDQFNIKCGFALIGQDSFVNPNGRGSRYLFYQNKGYSCLNHNSSAADLESYTTEAEAAAAISSSKKLLDNLGIVTNGWVCPNNKWVSNFRNLLGSFHAYAFGDHGYGEGTQVYDVNTRTQDILRLHRYDIQDISTLQAIKDTIDLACQNGYMVCFYGHAARIGMEGYYTMAMIQEIIEYLIVKRNAGQCFLSSPDEVVKYYFNL